MTLRRAMDELDHYVFDQVASDQLADVARRYADLARERQAIIAKLTPITLATWPEIQSAQQAVQADAPADDAAPAGQGQDA